MYSMLNIHELKNYRTDDRSCAINLERFPDRLILNSRVRVMHRGETADRQSNPCPMEGTKYDGCLYSRHPYGHYLNGLGNNRRIFGAQGSSHV